MVLVTPVILCGGAGSRLWPASRESFPKQLIAFSGGHSLLQDTLLRVAGDGFGKPIVVTSNETRFLVAEQVRALGIDAIIILEPMRRDSCAAIMAATAYVAAKNTSEIMMVLAADHAIPDVIEFQKTVLSAVPAAQAGHIVTFGIVPDSPATGYGYIKPNKAVLGLNGVEGVSSFVEKPNSQTAQRLIDEGHYWNSGNFLFRADTMISEAKNLVPDILKEVTEAVAKARNDIDFLKLEEEAFARARSISIDYAIMEKTPTLVVMPSHFRWSDIGSWDAAWQIADKDSNGNAALGEVHFHGATNSLAHSTGTLTALVGVENVVVVVTRDAVLVVARDKVQSVRDLVRDLEKAGHKEAVEHLRNYRPWGNYEQIDRGSRYQVKRITVKPGGILSLQSHFHRAEHWVVVSGTAKVTINEVVQILSENQSVYVPLGVVHRMENPGHLPLELIEVQSGSYLGEDDIVRYEDVYGRN